MQVKSGKKFRSSSAPAASPSGNCQLRMSTVIAMVTVTVMLLLCILVFNYQRFVHLSSQPEAESISIVEYQQLIGRAHSLIKRYKQLRGNESFESGKFAFKIPYAAQTFPPPTGESSSQSKQPANTLDSKVALRSKDKKATDDDTGVVVEMYPQQSSPRDAVMGMAMNPDISRLAVFLKSLRRVSSCSIILVLNAPLSSRTQQLVTEFNVKLYKFEPSELPPKLNSFHPSSLRWLLFRSYVKSHENMRVLYNRLWVVDVQETYFQSDPFLFVNPNTPSFHVFAVPSSPHESSEVGRDSDGEALRLSQCLPSPSRGALSSHPALSSNLVVGTTEEMLAYIQLMASVLSGESRDRDLTSRLPACQHVGVDQAVHNLLVYLHKMPKVITWQAPQSPVAQVPEDVVLHGGWGDESGAKNASQAVVYGYGRQANLARQILARMGEGGPPHTLPEAWGQEPTCRGYEFKADVDMFKGRCDLTTARAGSSAASCCAICSGVPRCMSFTFTAGNCFLKACKGSATMLGEHVDRAVSGWKV